MAYDITRITLKDKIEECRKDNSSLGAQYTMAAQNDLIIAQNEEIIRLLKEILSNTEPEDSLF